MQSRKDSTDGALRVLTLHGDGLQGLSIVSVIDELCSRIAEANGLTQYCRPSELFDVICGTGIGALIAVLLGRYCLDIGKCKEVYMDLAEFVEERQAARRGLRTGTIEEEDIHEFMEILIKEEGWSDVMEIPATVGRKKCQHVFMARSRNQHDGKSIIQLGSQAQIETLRRRSLPSSTKPARIPRVLAASVANGIRDWLPISNANIGPQRPESSNLDGISREPRSPARWVMDMTSPIRTVVMWPLKVTKRTLLASEPVLEADNESPVCGGRRAKSLSLIQWPIHGLIAPIDNTADSERGERQELVQEQVQQLLSETSEKRLFDFSSSLTASYETSDMADLKETRSNIKHIIGLMNDTGLFEEAARCFGQP
ncbi:hypothetical protein LTR70_001783 [Exophiala xenobiotica]|nr:hypothetical protein LTR70_001783 [Exophiala xenobiotica]